MVGNSLVSQTAVLLGEEAEKLVWRATGRRGEGLGCFEGLGCLESSVELPLHGLALEGVHGGGGLSWCSASRA